MERPDVDVVYLLSPQWFGLHPAHLACAAGKAVVVISSYLPEIMALSDRILVSRQGKVVEEYSALEATEEKIMYAAIH